MLNHIAIQGRLVRDVELRYTGSNIPVASFTLAVDQDFAGNDGKKGVDFIDCVAWRKTGEFAAKYFGKGQQAVAEGRLQIRNWTDKEGNKRRSAEVNVEHMYFCGSKNDNAQGGYSGAQGGFADPQVSGEDYAMLTDDDAQLPF